MSACGNLELDLVRQNNDLTAQYKELLCLRAKVAGLLFPLKKSPPRGRGIARSNRSAARVMQLNTRPASTLPILLLWPERPILKPHYTSPFGLG
jgi:hypothetical protein